MKSSIILGFWESCSFVWKDSSMMNFVLEELKGSDEDIFNKHFGEKVNKNKKNNNISKIKKNSEQCKINYNTNNKASCSLNSICDDDGIEEIELTKDEWDRIVKEIISRCEKAVLDTLKSVNLEMNDINKVIMIGGSCQIKEMSSAMEKLFGKEKIVNSEGVGKQQAVAMGACLEADRIANSKNMYSIEESSLIPIGIEASFNDESFIYPLIKLDQQPPYEKTVPIKTVLNHQKTFDIKLYKGESEKVKENNYITTFKLDNLPNKNAGEVEANLTVKYTGGKLEVTGFVTTPKGYENSTKKTVSVEVKM